jgi:hypothetical protein
MSFPFTSPSSSQHAKGACTSQIARSPIESWRLDRRPCCAGNKGRKHKQQTEGGMTISANSKLNLAISAAVVVAVLFRLRSSGVDRQRFLRRPTNLPQVFAPSCPKVRALACVCNGVDDNDGLAHRLAQRLIGVNMQFTTSPRRSTFPYRNSGLFRSEVPQKHFRT